MPQPGLLMRSRGHPVITLEGGRKNKTTLSISDTLFQTVFISGDRLVPGAEQDVFFIWFMSWVFPLSGEIGGGWEQGAGLLVSKRLHSPRAVLPPPAPGPTPRWLGAG